MNRARWMAWAVEHRVHLVIVGTAWACIFLMFHASTR